MTDETENMLVLHKKDINQIKLVTGQEIIANVLERRDDGFVLNYALDMVPLELEQIALLEEAEALELEENQAYYIMRPFVSYADSLENQVVVNPFTVVSANIPSDKVIAQYFMSVTQIQDNLVPREEIKPSGNVVSFPKKYVIED